ncbi:MAG: anti-sigma factor [Myxococcota bacterium]|nr:anti-sigma factor [Myxococcota bacterium]
MNHADIQDYMADYLEGHLPLEKRALFDAHLDDCEACMGELRDVQRTVHLLRSLPEPEMPEGFSNSVMRRVREADARPHWLQSLSDALSILSRPRILVPVSISMIALGILAGTGAVEDALLLEAPRGQLAESSRNADASALAGIPGTATRFPAPQESRIPRTAAIQITVQPALPTTSLPGPFRPSSRGLGEFVRLFPQQFSQREAEAWGAGDGVSQGVRLPGQPMVLQAAVGDQSRRLGDSGFMTSGQTRRNDRQPSADEWLVRLRRSPENFAMLVSNSTLAEQELWVANLARRAVERDELAEIVEVLRASPNQRARLLADDFAAYGRGPMADASRGGQTR